MTESDKKFVEWFTQTIEFKRGSLTQLTFDTPAVKTLLKIIDEQEMEIVRLKGLLTNGFLNAQIVYGVSQYLPTWSSNTNSSVTQFITPPGIANGKGATAFLVGTLLGSLTGQIEVGDQTAVTTMFAGLYVSGFGLNSTTNVRSFTTAASVYIEGPPTNR